MVELSNRADVQRWLKDKPREFAIVIAARAALRAVPTLATALGPRGGGARETGRDIVLPTLRAVAVPWVTARYSLQSEAFRHASDMAFLDAEVAHALTNSNISFAVGAARAAAATVYVDQSSARSARSADAVAAAGDSWSAAGIYAAASVDANAIAGAISTDDLAGYPLWPKGTPPWSRANWMRLRNALVRLDEDWEVWTDWYSARVEGRSANEALEIARVLAGERIWRQTPEVINAEIRRLIDFHSEPHAPVPDEATPSDGISQRQIAAVPPQGPGPRFRASDEGPVDRAPPADLDAEGNDTKTIGTLRPLALRCAADLTTRLPPNQFGELLSAVNLYVAALNPGEGKTIEWGEVWGQGVILQNAATAAERKVDERILPALEDPAKTALDSLLTLHGPMILATRDGAKFSESAVNFRLTREQQEALRAAALRLAEQLKADKDVITPRAAASVAQATESIGQGPHPERGSVYGLATVKNISIVLVGGAAVATPALIGAFLGSVAIGALAGAPLSFVAVEAVKKSAAFNALVTQLGAKLDTISDDELRTWLEERSRRYAPFRRFVARNAEPLRKIAEATPELKWMLRYIDFIAEKPEQN